MTSRDFETLYKRATKKRAKRFLLIALIVLVMIAAVIFLYLYISTIKPTSSVPKYQNEKKISQELPKSETKIKEEKKSDFIEPIQTPKDNNTSVVIEENSTISEAVDENESGELIVEEEPNVQELVQEIKPYDTLFLKLNLPKDISSQSDKTEKSTPEAKIEIEKSEEEKEQIQAVQEKKKDFSLQVREVNPETALLERFNSANDFSSAIALAQLYLTKGSYSKSIHWTKIASKLEPSSPVPWKVYAEAKRAQGDSADAIRALQMYLEYFNDEGIRKLLQELQKENG